MLGSESVGSQVRVLIKVAGMKLKPLRSFAHPAMFFYGIVICALAVPTVAVAEVREWKDKSGKFSLRAELVDVDDGQVKLKRVDGKIVNVVTNRLSASDQAYVRRQRKRILELKRVLEEYEGDPHRLLHLFLDNAYRADVGELPPESNDLVQRKIRAVLTNVRQGKVKPKPDALPKFVELLRSSGFTDRVLIFPGLDLKWEQLASLLTELETPASRQFFVPPENPGQRNAVPQLTAEALAASKPIQWYAREWLHMGFVDGVLRVVTIAAK